MATEVLRARVEKDLARKVQRWAKDHDMDVSAVVRLAVQRLLREGDVERRIAARMRKFDAYEHAGLFDPPKGDWKAGGFR